MQFREKNKPPKFRKHTDVSVWDVKVSDVDGTDGSIIGAFGDAGRFFDDEVNELQWEVIDEEAAGE